MTEKAARSPLLLRGVTKEYIWAGENLAKKWNKTGRKISESWEVSTLKGNETQIVSGEYFGKTLNEYLNVSGEKAEEFPLLIKLIDSAKNLSIQVHPNDELAHKLENKPFGKTEMWYIIACEEGAGIYNGFNRDVTREEVKERIKDGTLEEILNFIKVKAGDMFQIPAGRIHAIGEGITLLEAQQSSDITYRVFDFNRVDANGRTRELHVDKALLALSFEKTPVEESYNISSCKAFEGCTVNKECVCGSKIIAADEGYSFITIVEEQGEGVTVNDTLTVQAGDTFLLPRNMNCEITGSCLIIITKVSF